MIEDDKKQKEKKHPRLL